MKKNAIALAAILAIAGCGSEEEAAPASDAPVAGVRLLADVPVFEAPDGSSQVLAMRAAGQVYEITGEAPDFWQVRSGAGFGWVRRSTAARVLGGESVTPVGTLDVRGGTGSGDRVLGEARASETWFVAPVATSAAWVAIYFDGGIGFVEAAGVVRNE